MPDSRFRQLEREGALNSRHLARVGLIQVTVTKMDEIYVGGPLSGLAGHGFADGNGRMGLFGGVGFGNSHGYYNLGLGRALGAYGNGRL